MKAPMGTSPKCTALKSMSSRVGEILCCRSAPNKYTRLDSKLERKMVELKRSSSGHNKFKSINSIILKFPQFREGLTEIRDIFDQYDEDSNGSIDREELKKCLDKMHFQLREKEVDDLFYSCDMDESEGIQFNEFIVLLCLIYLLMDSSTTSHTTSKMGSSEIEATFNTIIEAFLFLDKNGDGKLNKQDMVKALNDASRWEKSPSHITQNRFKEMDWDRNGKISFREFLFAFINWVGVDSDDDSPIPITEDSAVTAKKEGKKIIRA